MRFMIMVRANEDTEADVKPGEQLIADMATYHEELAKAGALVDASGLQPSSKGWRIRYSGKKRIVVDGPYTEAKEFKPNRARKRSNGPSDFRIPFHMPPS